MRTSCSLELTIVAAATFEEVFGGGIGGGGGGGNDGCPPLQPPPGEIEERSMGESVSSVNRSSILSSNDGSMPVSVAAVSADDMSLEKPIKSSCCTGCRGNKGKNNLLSA